MFEQPVDERLSAWAAHRDKLNQCDDPMTLTSDFWRFAPFIPYNKDIDPFNQQSWPTPWEIIVGNRYDDFTKALMMAWSLKYTQRYKDSKIEIKTLVDRQKNCYYNIVSVDDTWALNYNDNGPEPVENIPESFFLENLIELGKTW
jgi:transposase